MERQRNFAISDGRAPYKVKREQAEKGERYQVTVTWQVTVTFLLPYAHIHVARAGRQTPDRVIGRLRFGRGMERGGNGPARAGQARMRAGCTAGWKRTAFPGSAGRTSARLNRRSPAIEKVPMMSTRINQTINATKTGTTLVRVLWPTTSVESSWWLRTATATPHQVSMAFMAAASSQAPNRYQTSAGSSWPCCGVKSRAMPAKSIPQKAMDRIVAQLMPQETQIRAQHIRQGKDGGGIVEDLEGEQGQQKNPAKDHAASLRKTLDNREKTFRSRVHSGLRFKRNIGPYYRTIVLFVKEMNGPLSQNCSTTSQISSLFPAIPNLRINPVPV